MYLEGKSSRRKRFIDRTIQSSDVILTSNPVFIPLEDEWTPTLIDNLFEGNAFTAATAEDDSSDEEDEYTRIYGSHIRANFD